MVRPTPFTVSLRYATMSLSISAVSVLSTLIAPLLLTRLPQGQELLDIVSDDQLFGFTKDWTTLLHYVLFIVALLAWAFANWYGSRVLLQFDFHNPLPPNTRGHRFIANWNEWQPRVLGIVGPALIAGYILHNHQWYAGGIAAAAVVGFAAFIIKRRKIFKLASVQNSIRTELLKGDRIAIWLGFACSFVMFSALFVVNYSFSRTLGAPVILFCGLASIVLTGSVLLSYMPLSMGWPNLGWLPLFLAFIFGATPLTHNHSVSAHAIEGVVESTDPRPSVIDDFKRWKMAHATGPIFLVAAEGGASRSGWWTAHVLTTLDWASDGEFSRHVYAVSGVSGGSLGAATYVGLLAQRGNETPTFSEKLKFPEVTQCWDMRAKLESYPTPMQAECFVGEDFLSPTLGYLLYPDLVQRFFPYPVHRWDRSLGLELSWQNDWAHLFDGHKFGETLDTLYHDRGDIKQPRKNLPLLFLNSTRAQKGRSALQSPVAIPSMELDDVFDENLHTRTLPLAAVVHNSARFPLVSPGGEVEYREKKGGGHWDTLVDGGYFENSGAATLTEMIRALQENHEISDDDLKRIHVIFIMNDPRDERSVFMKQERPTEVLPRISQEELLTPVMGLYNPRGARADASKRTLVKLLGAEENDGRITEIFLSRAVNYVRTLKDHENDPDPSMSWYLNPRSRLDMWIGLGEQRTYEALRNVLGCADTDRVCQRLQEFQNKPPEEARKPAEEVTR